MIIFALLIFGFIFLVKGADLLVDGASSLARKTKISELAIGLTIVAFGTSCPELTVNIISALKGQTDIAVGNIIGSNIVNILLILGISSLIYPLAVSKGTVYKEIPMSFLAVLLLGILANDVFIDRQNFSALTRIDGLVLLAFFIIFLFYTFSIVQNVEGLEDFEHSKLMSVSKSLLFIFLGLIGLTLGGKWIVDGAVFLAEKLNVSTKFVGLTIVAIGTSLPELATSVVAALKKNPDIAVGNIVGSNIFNIFFILGITAIIRPVNIPVEINFDIAVLILSSLLLFFFMFTGEKRKLDRWEGLLLIFFYLGYIFYLIKRG